MFSYSLGLMDVKFKKNYTFANLKCFCCAFGKIKQKLFIVVLIGLYTMEKSLLSKLSKELEIPEKKILDESLNVFLDSELRNASAEILKIKKQFNVSKPVELKKKIENGKVEEHPAWEHLIYWENLNKRIKVVNDWMQKLHISS